MAKVPKSMKLDAELARQIEKLAGSAGVSFNSVVEDLLLQGISEQESEIAASFLIPKIEDVVNAALTRQFDRLGKLMARTAIESSISARLVLVLYSLGEEERRKGFSTQALRQLREEAWAYSFQALRRGNREVMEVLAAVLGEEGAPAGG